MRVARWSSRNLLLSRPGVLLALLQRVDQRSWRSIIDCPAPVPLLNLAFRLAASMASSAASRPPRGGTLSKARANFRHLVGGR